MIRGQGLIFTVMHKVEVLKTFCLSVSPISIFLFLSICVSDLELYGFAEHHLVEGPDEESVKQFAVEDGHAGDPADELEVGEMVLIAHTRVWVDLQYIN